MSRFPADPADTDVVAVEVTGPHRVRVVHRPDRGRVARAAHSHPQKMSDDRREVSFPQQL